MSVQLSSTNNFNVKNIVLSEPKTEQIRGEDGKSTGSYQRITIQTKYDDGTVGDLIFCTPELFSFGISEVTNPQSGLVDGHTLSLCLWNRDRSSNKYVPTKEQKQFTDTLEAIGDEIKERMRGFYLDKKLLPSYSKYKNFEAMEAMITGCPFYWGKQLYEAIPTEGCENTYENGPTLYAKLLESKKKNKILTQFTDYAGNDIVNPLALFNSANKLYCTTYAAIRIESIFIGSTGIKVQMKVYEAQCKAVESGPKRLLPRRQMQVQHEDEGQAEPLTESNFGVMNNDTNDETGSINGDNDENEAREKSPQKPKLRSSKFTKKVVKVTSDDS